jgi:endonuclease YncB( thermonuclease family)
MARLLLTALALFFASPALAETIIGQASVIDGDTLEIHGQRIRLSGIDAHLSPIDSAVVTIACGAGPNQPTILNVHIAGTSVSCEGLGRDRYWRVVAVCSVDARTLRRGL